MSKKSPLHGKKANIFGKKASIKVQPKGTFGSDGEEVAGYFDPLTYDIFINGRFGDIESGRTLFHELNHSVLIRTGLYQTSMSSDHHELVCENIGNWVWENIEFLYELKKSVDKKK